jgi:hypothetical protein
VVEEIELEGPVVGWLLGGVQRDRTHSARHPRLRRAMTR